MSPDSKRKASLEPMIEFPKGVEKPLSVMLRDWIDYYDIRIRVGEGEAGASQLRHVMGVCITQLDRRSAADFPELVKPLQTPTGERGKESAAEQSVR